MIGLRSGTTRKGTRGIGLLLFFGVSLAVSSFAMAGDAITAPYNPLKNVMRQRANSRLGKQVPGSALVNIVNEGSVTLDGYFDKPLFIIFVRTEDKADGEALLTNFSGVVRSLRSQYGDQAFRAIALGVDPVYDTGAALSNMAYRLGLSAPVWKIATTDEATLAEIAAGIGYLYINGEKGEVTHEPMVTLVAQGGLVVEHFYGQNVSLTEIEEPLALQLVRSNGGVGKKAASQ